MGEPQAGKPRVTTASLILFVTTYYIYGLTEEKITLGRLILIAPQQNLRS